MPERVVETSRPTPESQGYGEARPVRRVRASFCIMESIFSVASRRGTVPEEFGRQRRDGALKMCWTKPSSSEAVCGSRPNRWMNGTNLEFMGIELLRCSVRSMGYSVRNMPRYR
jgi:hypothetical protein